jgi:hypothetical protein
MLYQEDLREKQVVAVWVGSLQDEDAVIEYLGQPFEQRFGFLLDYDDLPEYAQTDGEPGKVRELLKIIPTAGDWVEPAIRLCHERGFKSARTVIAFHNLHYRPELQSHPEDSAKSGLVGGVLHRLGLPSEADGKLHFVGNVPWLEGEQSWNILQSKRLIAPPFPKLIRHDFGEECDNLWYWKAHVRLESWKGFATHAELSSDGWAPSKGCLPDGDFNLTVDPVSRTESVKPTVEQARAFEILTGDQVRLREAVLAAVLKVYPEWRENHFGGQWSEDGGKTSKSGWELPDMFPPDAMPEIRSSPQLTRIIHPSGFDILTESQERIAHIRIGFHCKWDEEHGFAVLIRGGKEIFYG